MGGTRSSRLGRRRVATAVLVANSVKPFNTQYTSPLAFALGWPTTELAPQLLAATLADTALTAYRRRLRPAGAALALGSAAGLAFVIQRARATASIAEAALREGLGADYATQYGGVDTPVGRIGLTQIARPFRLSDPAVEVAHNINYTEGGRRARLDIYRPRRPLQGAPVLIQIHGGGWTIGAKEEQGRLLMNRMCRQGWICVAVNYRLSPKHKWPTHIIDVKRSLAWVRENIASYGGDPDYLVLTGGSAGGHLASLAALTPHVKDFQPGFEDADTHVAACVPFYGVYDMLGEDHDRYTEGLRDQFLAQRVFGIDDVPANLESFRIASPLHHVDAGAPDFFLLHGTNDSLVSVRQARAFAARLRQLSTRTVTYAELPGAQHAFEVFGSIRAHYAVAAAERWLRWHRRMWMAREGTRG